MGELGQWITEAGLVSGQIHHENTVGREAVIGLGVKAGVGQFRGYPQTIEGIDQNHIGSRLMRGDKTCGVVAVNSKALIVFGDTERLAEGNHMRVDFYRRDIGARQMAIAEFGNRAAAQAK